MSSGYWNTCTIVCWLLAALAGLFVFFVSLAPTSFIAALLVGVALAVFLGVVLTRLFCEGGAAVAQGTTAESTAAKTVESKSPDAYKAAATEDAAAKATADQAAAEEAAAKAAAQKSASEKTAADKAAQTAAEATPDYDGDGVKEGTNEGSRPAALDGPRDGGADDLKQIKGIGPKLETLCNSLGFYHFDQIAAWTADEVAWVDANLKGFKGRVSRDTWVEQARVLASGGETEFSKRVEDGDVY